ncbi:MAG: metallophosphoesterase [Candidatus Coproplasma sp.]
MKYFAFSDAHGDYNALMEAVKEYGYQPENPDHTLISCGDNFGRAETGEGSRGIYEYLTSPIHKNPPVCLMGNHELILINILLKRSISAVDIQNGEHKTLYSFLDMNPEEVELTPYAIDCVSRSSVTDWLLDRPFWFETANYIFLHGFLPFDWEQTQFITENLASVSREVWENSCWAQTPTMIDAFKTFFPDGLKKWIVFGHWHNVELRKKYEQIVNYETRHSIWKDGKLKLIGLDNCTILSHKIEMLVIDD